MTDSSPAVRQLRLVVEADDLDAAIAFYRDVLGLPEQAAFSGEGDARVVILEAGRATLELANPAQRRMIDRVEVGRELSPDEADPHIRVAFEVDDADAVVASLVAGGATALAPSVQTPWRSRNARLTAPAGLQLTVFTELEPLADGTRREGFGTQGEGSGPGATPGGPAPEGEEDPVLAVALRQAVALAEQNAREGQLPFGAVVLRDGETLATGVNTALADHDPTAHAEVAALRAACRRLGTTDLSGAVMVASCEPCAMCHTACAAAGISRLVYAAAKEWVPDLGGPDRTVMRSMQSALRTLRPEDVTHMPTTGARTPLQTFVALTGSGGPDLGGGGG
ncbi:hypothetical protein BH23ACT9_BH23ACT9_32110 [soil metagenome]